MSVTHAPMPLRSDVPQPDYLICGHTTPSQVVHHGWYTADEICDSVNLLCTRNVWERLVSLFSLLRTKGWRHSGLERWHNSDDFAAYVAWVTSPDREPSYHPRNYQCQPAGDWLTIDGRPVPFHAIGRFERLGDYWHDVCAVFGVKGDMPRLNGAPHKPYREYYTTELRYQVADFYAEEIAAFRWEF